MARPNGDRTVQATAVPRRVLVATETGTSSAGAEQAALELAARVDASLIFLSVIDPSGLRLPGGLFHTRVDQVRAQRVGGISRLVEEARRRGIAAQFLIWEGEPGTAIVEAAGAEGADLIIVGSHARGPLSRLLMGSVSASVVLQSRRPVLVVRPGETLDDVWSPRGTDRRSSLIAES